MQELPQKKRNGSRIAGSTVSSLAFDKTKSASQAIGLLNSMEFLPEMEAEIKEHPEAVVKKLETLRKHRQDSTFPLTGDCQLTECPYSIGPCSAAHRRGRRHPCSQTAEISVGE